MERPVSRRGAKYAKQRKDFSGRHSPTEYRREALIQLALIGDRRYVPWRSFIGRNLPGGSHFWDKGLGVASFWGRSVGVNSIIRTSSVRSIPKSLPAAILLPRRWRVNEPD
jgi:hypothetical protein